jgi:hypothetical protein
VDTLNLDEFRTKRPRRDRTPDIKDALEVLMTLMSDLARVSGPNAVSGLVRLKPRIEETLAETYTLLGALLGEWPINEAVPTSILPT